MIGARGEILFGLASAVSSRVRVRLADGLERGAVVLGFDRGLGVGVARLDAGPSPVPPRVDLSARLDRDCWMVVLTHDKRGAPTSHAGQVAGAGPRGAVRVDVPARRGSPLFSAEGALIGVSLRKGRRRTVVRPMANLMPFLERVVVGDGR